MPSTRDGAPTDDGAGGWDRNIPSWLSLPPSETVEPPVNTRPQVLPVHRLSWENFERLCLRLLRHSQEIERVLTPGTTDGVTRLYGTRGQEQQGIDVYSRDPLPLDAAPPERPAVCLQARRLKQVTKSGINKAISDFLEGTWAPTSRKFVYATSASGVATQFTDEIEAQASRMAEANIELAVWDEEEISEQLRDTPELVDDFFGRPWVEAFCGRAAAEDLGARLDGEQAAQLREEVRRIYTAAFGLADPGTVLQSTPTSTVVPLAERFVTPDVYPLHPSDAYPEESLASASTDSGGKTPHDQDIALAQHDSSSRFGEPVRRGGGALDGDWLGFSSSLGRTGDTSRIGTTLADEWLGSAQRQIVIGDPGAGKSTLLRHLVLDLLSDQPVWATVAEHWGNRLPVWLPFHFFTQRVAGRSGHEASVVQAIRAWVDQHDIGHAWPLIQRALDDDRLLLIVDGLDEWSEIEAGEYAVAALETFASARSIALVASSRPYGLQRLRLGPGWTYAKIGSLSPDQQRSLARTYFENGLEESARTPEAIETTVAALMSEIKASADLRTLAGVPLFLILLVSLRLATGARLPNRRFELFERAIQLLIDEHPTRRRVAAAVTGSRQGLRDRQLRTVLAQVAFQAQTRGDVATIDERHMRQDLIAALRDPDILALDQAGAIQQADAIAEVAEGELGLLVRQGPREVSFIHRCLQEQLAADHITTRLSADEQHRMLFNRLGDIRWREVLLGVMWLTVRPDERRSLATALIERVDDTPVGLQAAEVLAEIVFGPYDLPGAMSREQAQVLADRIETHPLLSHRARLVAHFVTGLDNVALQGIVESKLASWTSLAHPPRGALVAELGRIYELGAAKAGPARAIIDALRHLDPGIVWAAARVLVDRLSDGRTNQDEHDFVLTAVEETLASPTSAPSAAAALTVLCLAWPNNARTARAVEFHRHSRSSAVRMVALAHLLGVLQSGLLEEPVQTSPSVDQLTENERAWVLGQISDRSDPGGHGGIERATVDAAAISAPETLDYVLERMKEGSGPDLDSVWGVALSAYADDKRIADVVAQQIATEERPWPLLSVGRVPQRLSSAYGSGNPHRELVAAAIEARLERFDTTHREMELHALAAIDQGPRMKDVLLRALADSTVPHWPASALLENFADDPEVVSALREALMSDSVRAARLGSFARKVLGSASGRERLLGILRALVDQPALQRQARYDAIANGLIDCCADLTDQAARESICAEALELIPAASGPWDGDTAFFLAVHFYPCPSAKEVLESRAETSDARDLPGLWFAFRDEPAANRPLIERARQLLRVPPPSIRYEINELLSTEMALPEFVISSCASWADEDSGPVKSMASLAYHRALLSERVRGSISDDEWSHALDHLGDVAASYGPDHEVRRRAAWVGMCVIGDWSPVDSRVETIGDPEPVGVDIGDPLAGTDEVLLHELGRRWDELRKHFGSQLITRLSGLRAKSPKDSTWGHLAKVASHFPVLSADLRSAVAAESQFLSNEAILAWYVADQRRSRAAATELVGRHVSADDNSRGPAVLIAQDPKSFNLDGSRLIELMEEHARETGGWFGNAKLETLAALRPSHPVVQRAWRQIAQLIQASTQSDAPSTEVPPDVGDDGWSVPFDADGRGLHVQTYLAVAYSCIPSDDVGWLLERDLGWMAQRGDELTYYEPALVRHLRRRLRADPIAVQSVHSAAAREDTRFEVATQILSLLAAISPAGVPVLQEIDGHLGRVEDMPVAPLVRDIVVGASISAQASLLNAAAAIRS